MGVKPAMKRACLVAVLAAAAGAVRADPGVYNHQDKPICVRIEQTDPKKFVCEKSGRHRSVVCAEPAESSGRFTIEVGFYDPEQQTCDTVETESARSDEMLIFDGEQLCCCYARDKKEC